MGKWTQYDEDEYRLPEGVRRIGYDADTQKYTYAAVGERRILEGSEGAMYGNLRRVSEDVVDRASAAERDSESFQPTSEVDRQRNPYRMMLPFFLIIFALLLLVTRILAPAILHGSQKEMCMSPSRVYKVQKGDTCWEIGKVYGVSVSDIENNNPGKDCTRLAVGEIICIPGD